MNKFEQLELVRIENNNGTIKASFIDEIAEEIKEVNFHLDKYDRDSNKYVKDDEQYMKTVETLDKYFGITLDSLDDALGQYHDIYEYYNFCSLWEVDEIKRFSEEMKGDIFQAPITQIFDNGNAIIVRYEKDGEIYQSKMNYSTYYNNKWYVDKQKKNKQYTKFEEKFGVPVEEADNLIGREIMIEVRAFGKNLYGDMKKLK